MMAVIAEVRVLVLSGYGLNCDHETAYAFELAGAKADRVHMNALIDGSADLDSYQIMAFSGGFGWGDDHGAGVVQAIRLKTNIGHKILDFVEKGNLIIGICNGFQVLVNLGLLPGLDRDYGKRSIALTYNDCGNFRDDWVHLAVNSASPCVFTRGLEVLELPIRHGEGKFVTDTDILSRLEHNQQVAVRYSLPDGGLAKGEFPHNPNGSMDDIAGLCDPTGRIFGLMPHPEAYSHWTNHPDWVRRKVLMKRNGLSSGDDLTQGSRMLQNAVHFLRGR